MDRLEEFLRRGLLNRQTGILMERTENCPDEEVLVNYLYNASPERDIELHIIDCPWCIEQIVIAHKAQTGQAASEQAPPDAVARAKSIVSPKAGTASRVKSLKRNLWLVATVFAFTLSFIFPRYFLQFLAATLILGIKWVSESDQIRTLIVTLDSRREKKDSDISSNRLKNKIKDHSA